MIKIAPSILIKFILIIIVYFLCFTKVNDFNIKIIIKH